MMSNDNAQTSPAWQENLSEVFIDLGRIMIPRRDEIEQTIVSLIPADMDDAFTFVDVAAGAGWLSAAILDRFPRSRALLLDGSTTMLDEAENALTNYTGRFHVKHFQLLDLSWTDDLPTSTRAVVSSLAIHHLNDTGKRAMFQRIASVLAPGGALLIADLVQPAGERSLRYAAQAWNAEVRRQSQELTGSLDAWELFDGDAWNIFDHPDPMDMPSKIADQLDWLREAGFVDADVFWALAGHAFYGGFLPE